MPVSKKSSGAKAVTIKKVPVQLASVADLKIKRALIKTVMEAVSAIRWSVPNSTKDQYPSLKAINYKHVQIMRDHYHALDRALNPKKYAEV